MLYRFFSTFMLLLTVAYSASEEKIPSSSKAVRQHGTTGETVICNQYIGQNNSTNEAIKRLDDKLSKKLDELTKLLGGKPSNTPPGVARSSCREIYNNNLSLGNKAYLLRTDSGNIPVYCHMTSAGLGACGGGGWTLVMKTDGTKRTFHYNSPLWSNKNPFNIPGGKTGLDHHETKLPTYWTTPFSSICLAMKVGPQVRAFVIHKHANSLYSLIADGQYRPTSVGRDTWKSLFGPQASLQRNCNKEGFNVATNIKARIGILSNQENDCSTCDSKIGFGLLGHPDDSNSCGNEAIISADNGDKHIKAMGYIFVQ